MTRDKAMIDLLKSIGIVKGQVFEPDAATQAILADAVVEAHAYLDLHYEDVFVPPFYEDGRWALPAVPEMVEGMPSFFSDPNSYPTDGRAVTYSMAYFSAKHLGAGRFYLMAIRDKAGQPFDGRATYRLHVPANPPVELYWSATAYDRATHALIRDVSHATRSSQNPDLEANADGSVDVWFAPEPPAGKARNWVPTRAGSSFEVAFRVYGPQKELLNRSWVLPDIEKSAEPGTVGVGKPVGQRVKR